MNDQPRYVAIAGDLAKKIRSGDYPPGMQLPSQSDLAVRYEVSEIVIRKAVELLESQGLTRSVRRKGIYVTDRPTLIRVTPERQMEGPEETFRTESNKAVEVDRETERIPADEEQAETFGVPVGRVITHVVTRVSEGGTPVSISDTYHPVDVTNVSRATYLEEEVADRLPEAKHASWLGVSPGILVRSVRQKFMEGDKTIMISNVSYHKNRYDAFVYRMRL